MTRIEFLPTPTPDGRHVILRAVKVTPTERLRRFVRRVLRARA
jgi:hypothetical protein